MQNNKRKHIHKMCMACKHLLRTSKNVLKCLIDVPTQHSNSVQTKCNMIKQKNNLESPRSTSTILLNKTYATKTHIPHARRMPLINFHLQPIKRRPHESYLQTREGQSHDFYLQTRQQRIYKKHSDQDPIYLQEIERRI